MSLPMAGWLEWDGLYEMRWSQALLSLNDSMIYNICVHFYLCISDVYIHCCSCYYSVVSDEALLITAPNLTSYTVNYFNTLCLPSTADCTFITWWHMKQDTDYKTIVSTFTFFIFFFAFFFPSGFTELLWGLYRIPDPYSIQDKQWGNSNNLKSKKEWEAKTNSYTGLCRQGQAVGLHNVCWKFYITLGMHGCIHTDNTLYYWWGHNNHYKEFHNEVKIRRLLLQ